MADGVTSTELIVILVVLALLVVLPLAIFVISKVCCSVINICDDYKQHSKRMRRLSMSSTGSTSNKSKTSSVLAAQKLAAVEQHARLEHEAGVRLDNYPFGVDYIPSSAVVPVPHTKHTQSDDEESDQGLEESPSSSPEPLSSTAKTSHSDSCLVTITDEEDVEDYHHGDDERDPLIPASGSALYPRLSPQLVSGLEEETLQTNCGQLTEGTPHQPMSGQSDECLIQMEDSEPVFVPDNRYVKVMMPDFKSLAQEDSHSSSSIPEPARAAVELTTPPQSNYPVEQAPSDSSTGSSDLLLSTSPSISSEQLPSSLATNKKVESQSSVITSSSHTTAESDVSSQTSGEFYVDPPNTEHTPVHEQKLELLSEPATTPSVTPLPVTPLSISSPDLPSQSADQKSQSPESSVELSPPCSPASSQSSESSRMSEVLNVSPTFRSRATLPRQFMLLPNSGYEIPIEVQSRSDSENADIEEEPYEPLPVSSQRADDDDNEIEYGMLAPDYCHSTLPDFEEESGAEAGHQLASPFSEPALENSTESLTGIAEHDVNLNNDSLPKAFSSPSIYQIPEFNRTPPILEHSVSAEPQMITITSPKADDSRKSEPEITSEPTQTQSDLSMDTLIAALANYEKFNAPDIPDTAGDSNCDNQVAESESQIGEHPDIPTVPSTTSQGFVVSDTSVLESNEALIPEPKPLGSVSINPGSLGVLIDPEVEPVVFEDETIVTESESPPTTFAWSTLPKQTVPLIPPQSSEVASAEDAAETSKYSVPGKPDDNSPTHTTLTSSNIGDEITDDDDEETIEQFSSGIPFQASSDATGASRESVTEHDEPGLLEDSTSDSDEVVEEKPEFVQCDVTQATPTAPSPLSSQPTSVENLTHEPDLEPACHSVITPIVRPNSPPKTSSTEHAGLSTETGSPDAHEAQVPNFHRSLSDLLDQISLHSNHSTDAEDTEADEEESEDPTIRGDIDQPSSNVSLLVSDERTHPTNVKKAASPSQSHTSSSDQDSIGGDAEPCAVLSEPDADMSAPVENEADIELPSSQIESAAVDLETDRELRHEAVTPPIVRPKSPAKALNDRELALPTNLESSPPGQLRASTSHNSLSDLLDQISPATSSGELSLHSSEPDLVESASSLPAIQELKSPSLSLSSAPNSVRNSLSSVSDSHQSLTGSQDLYPLNLSIGFNPGSLPMLVEPQSETGNVLPAEPEAAASFDWSSLPRREVSVDVEKTAESEPPPESPVSSVGSDEHAHSSSASTSDNTAYE